MREPLPKNRNDSCSPKFGLLALAVLVYKIAACSLGFDCFADAVDRVRVRCGSHVDLIRCHQLIDGVELTSHGPMQSLVNLVNCPVLTRSILRPFKIADRHATCIRQDVRHDQRLLVVQNHIGILRRWPACNLDDHLRNHPCRVISSDLVFECGRNQDVDIQFQ